MEKIPQQVELSTEIEMLFKQDQAGRSIEREKIDWDILGREDAVRLKRAKEIYALYHEGTAQLDLEDLYRLAMVFQHSLSPEDHKCAQELATEAGKSGDEKALWLAAAAEDRYLLGIGQKQKWGTQYKKEGEKWIQPDYASDEESGVTDEMRKTHGVPSRAEQLSQFLSFR